MPPLKITEAKIEAKVVALCRKRKLYSRKFTSPAHRGAPDRIICGRGRVLFLELKRPGNVPTKLQIHEMTELRHAGMTATWVDTYEAAEKLINEHFFLSVSPYEVPPDPRSLI